jgi:hypothetical protein
MSMVRPVPMPDVMPPGMKAAAAASATPELQQLPVRRVSLKQAMEA